MFCSPCLLGNGKALSVYVSECMCVGVCNLNIFSLQRNDDHKVIFLLQNLRLLNGKDVTKLADHVRQINSQKLTSKVGRIIFLPPVHDQIVD